MRVALPFAALLASAVAGCAGLPRTSPEADLTRALRGRVADASVRCIDLQNVRSVAVFERTGLLYDTGRTLYLNRTGRPGSLRALDILGTRSFAGQLCRGEPVNLIDPSTRSIRSFVTLGDFIPYRRAG